MSAPLPPDRAARDEARKLYRQGVMDVRVLHERTGVPLNVLKMAVGLWRAELDKQGRVPKRRRA